MLSIQPTLSVAYLQLDIVWHNPKANRQRIDQLTASLPKSVELLFLPEMFTTGFTMEPEEVGEPMQGDTIQWMKVFARQKDILLGGSLVIKEGDHFVNRFLFAFPDGQVEYYDKRHLFNHAGEGDHYFPGQNRKIITYKGWRLMPMVCYDLRFPVWSRNNLDYDMLVYVANWPEPRIHHWDQLLLARAIENQCYTLGVNRTGVDGYDMTYIGHSCMAGFDGSLLQQADHLEGLYYAELDLEKMKTYRNTFSFLKDGDTFQIQ
jgi:predicted amidohydrolase